MMFWGLTIEPGKHYTQTVEESFHVSMAALETRDHVAESGGEKTGVVQVLVKHEKTEFLVCSLFYGTVFQQPLDLNFTEGEEVTFFTDGRGIVHLTGYLVKEEPLDIDQDMMSLEDASSSDEVSVSSEGMASGDASPGKAQAADKPRKRKKKRTRWKVNDKKGRLRNHQRKIRKTERGDIINPQRLPHQKTTGAKEIEDHSGFHMRYWTTTVVGNVRSETAGRKRTSTVDAEPPATAGKVSSNLSSQEDVTRPSKQAQSVKEQSSLDMDVNKMSDDVLPQQGSEIGSVLQETISVPFSKAVARTKESVGSPASKHSEKLSVNRPTQIVKTVSSTPQSTSCSVSVHKATNMNSTTQLGVGESRTKEHESVEQDQVAASGMSRTVREGVNKSPDVKEVEDDDDDDVLIEEIKIEDDSSDEEMTSFTSALPPPSQSSSASSTSTTQQTLPRITSVTSMSNQQQRRLLSNQQVGMYQEPASWNVPGPSRAAAGMSLQRHGGSLLPDQFILPNTSAPPHPVTLSMHDDQGVVMGGVVMGEVLEEDGEMDLSDEVLRAMPVATEMGELGPEDLQVNGMDISQQQILLAGGYRVFLTRGQLYEVQMAARDTTKTPWSVCVRRLMDIYFDRQTLAMGKATSHGFSNNPARKTLNQEVIQAIKDEADMSLQQLANEELDEDSEEEEEWSPQSGKKKPAKKKKPKKGTEEAAEPEGSPSKRKRQEGGDAEWVMWNQPPTRQSAKKARKTMAIAMATKHGLDLEEDSGEEDENGKPEKVNKGYVGSPNAALMVANLEDLDEDEDEDEDEDYVPGQKNKQIDAKGDNKDNSSKKADTDPDVTRNKEEGGETNDEEDEDYVPGKKSKKNTKGQKKDKALKKDKKDAEVVTVSDVEMDEEDEEDEDDDDYVPSNNAKKKKKGKKQKKTGKGDNDVEIVEVNPAATSPAATSDSKDDEEEEEEEDGDDEDYVPDKKTLKKTKTQSESDSSDSEDERRRRRKEEDEEPEASETDDSYNSEDDLDFEEEDEEEESDEEEEETTKEGRKNGQTHQDKKKGSKLQEVEGNKTGSNKKPKNKQDRKDVASAEQGVEGISSDKENMSATPGGKGNNANQDPAKKEQKKKPKQTKLKGGVTIQDLVEGKGKVAKFGRRAFVYYRGRLESNNKMFDSRMSGPPLDFRLGKGDVIKGWDTGVAGMRVGGKRLVTVPPSQGYGREREGRIPGNSTLIFEIELKNVK